MDICIDFDGTCVEHDYPQVGQTIKGAVEVLQELVAKGHRLILFTMRDELGVKTRQFSSGLSDAVAWFHENDIELYGVQKNPSQMKWTCSPKAYGHLYIDDAALGCPLIYPEGKRPYVDWEKIKELLIKRELL